MTDVTRILQRIETGDTAAAAELLPLVYDELRELAHRRISHEPGGQTLQGTALVHEAYARLVGPAGADQRWDNRRHFFAAAAEAMRRILIESARRKKAEKHGGKLRRVNLQSVSIAADLPPDDLFDLDQAFTELEAVEPAKAALVRLRFLAACRRRKRQIASGFPVPRPAGTGPSPEPGCWIDYKILEIREARRT